MPDAMDRPAVTVVVPTYNRAASLARLLDALADCDAPVGGREVIVVDDGSTDATTDVVRRSQVGARYVRQANRGPAAARNAGWRLARSDVVAFTDDDTVPDRRWLVDLVGELHDRPDRAAVGGTILPLGHGFLADFVQLERLVGHSVGDGDVRYLVTANAAWRLDALRAVGGFDERFPTAAGEDVDLSLRTIARGGRLGVTDRAVVRHDHRTSLRGLLRTYHRHGMSRQVLARRHAQLGTAATAAKIASGRYWLSRYRYYREAGGAARSHAVAYLVLRAAGSLSFAVGLVRARIAGSAG
ncbi:MAG TPA: glycosyltransferase [Acidimicrobiales bacterium]|nr:glycosyltransferase [Acidimicrobiales bacterium]